MIWGENQNFWKHPPESILWRFGLSACLQRHRFGHVIKNPLLFKAVFSRLQRIMVVLDGVAATNLCSLLNISVPEVRSLGVSVFRSVAETAAKTSQGGKEHLEHFHVPCLVLAMLSTCCCH